MSTFSSPLQSAKFGSNRKNVKKYVATLRAHHSHHKCHPNRQISLRSYCHIKNGKHSSNKTHLQACERLITMLDAHSKFHADVGFAAAKRHVRQQRKERIWRLFVCTNPATNVALVIIKSHGSANKQSTGGVKHGRYQCGSHTPAEMKLHIALQHVDLTPLSPAFGNIGKNAYMELSFRLCAPQMGSGNHQPHDATNEKTV